MRSGIAVGDDPILKCGTVRASRLIDVNPSGQLDSVIIEIDNLEEKSYFIDLYNVDKDGNKSVRVQTVGTAYGDRYESGLNNRLLLDIGVRGGDTLVTTWGQPPKGAVLFELNYVNKTQQPVTRIINGDQEIFMTDDWTPGSTLTYRTHYIPEPRAIDTFYTRYDTLTLPIPVVLSLLTDKSKWTITEVDSEEPAEGNADNPHNGLAIAAIDGNLGTFWHTQWQSSQPDYPHYFILDLGETYNVGAVESFRRRGNGSAQNLVQILISEDHENWMDKGTFEIDNQTDDGQLNEFEPGPARYIRYNAQSGSSVYAMLAELEVYKAE
ncbi:MAG TPA: DUF4998 domain-containing protein [Membranihabitans sp.]|nr:DUF4998 domain-containing protein [Membranihabitans sp.]